MLSKVLAWLAEFMMSAAAASKPLLLLLCVVSSLPTFCKVVPADYASAFLIGGCPLQGCQKKTAAAQGPPLAAAAAEVQRTEEDILEGRQARTSRRVAEVRQDPVELPPVATTSADPGPRGAMLSRMSSTAVVDGILLWC